MKIKIKHYFHGEGDFWHRMGHCFASALIQRELGVPLTSDEACTWFLAFDGDALAGFAAIKLLKGDVAELKHSYVFPAYRNNGVYTLLLRARLDYVRQTKCTLCRATVAPALQQHYAEAGFTEVRRQGRYVRFEIRLGA